MLPFFLYFAAGMVTAIHLLSLLSVSAYGGPFNPLELVALLGSVGLLVAAYVSLFKPYAAARVALIASLAIWSFYGPAIARTLRTRTSPAVFTPAVLSTPTAVKTLTP